MAATVDEVSGGRLVLGLGAGWNEVEFRAFGLPFDHLVSRFGEAFEIVRRLLDGERVTFHGRYHRVEDAVLLPPPARRPKLMIGANRPRMLSIALPYVDVWNTWFARYGNTVEGFARHNAEIDEAAERAGRDPRTGSRQNDERLPPVRADELRPHLRALEEAGADEAILVLDPITEDAIRSLSP
jgi:alkanesulfonate monooxygenase SsuD/methylene tetrahydromethanopterin reductase-like flavin-dependent oxidoreductase (luciferase family)